MKPITALARLFAAGSTLGMLTGCGGGAIAAAAATVITVASVGGGGGTDAGSARPPGPTVSDVTVAAPMYGQRLLVTIRGKALDADLGVASDVCSDLTRSTTAPDVSTATTAFYACTVTAVGAQSIRVTRASTGELLKRTDFDVPAPQVTMAIDNGAGIAGSLVITLEPDKTPVTVDNFLAYVNSGFYAGTIFHRVFPAFVIQGGGFLPYAGTPTLKSGTLAPIVLEVNRGLGNVQGSIAMARTSVPNSATSQFFINVVDNPGLDPGPTSAGYAVFGRVSANTALVSAIAGAPCGPVAGFSECLPAPPMLITAALQTR